MTSAVCQEFNCPPDVADRQDVARVRRIMSLRRFAEAKAELDSGTRQEDLTRSPAMELALMVQIKRARGEID